MLGDPAAYVRATKIAQLLLQKHDPTIRDDGKWGKFTQSVFDSAPAAIQAAVRDAVAVVTRGGTPEDLRQVREEQRSMATTLSQARPGDPESNWISAQQANLLVSQAAAEQGVLEYADELIGFLALEPEKRKNGTEYNVRSQNGSSRGLMQMQPAAWAESRALVPEIGGYENVWDPLQNIRAGVAYARINLRRMGKAVPVNAETLYLAHNQGAGFFTKGIRTAVDKQSKPVQAMIEKWYRPGGWK